MNIGNNIKIIRLRLGYSQKDLSQKTGLWPSTISKYENQHLKPNNKSINKLCIGLCCTYSDLLN